MKKVLLLMLVMVFVMVGCSSDPEPKSDLKGTPSPKTSETPTKEVKPTEAESKSSPLESDTGYQNLSAVAKDKVKAMNENSFNGAARSVKITKSVETGDDRFYVVSLYDEYDVWKGDVMVSESEDPKYFLGLTSTVTATPEPTEEPTEIPTEVPTEEPTPTPEPQVKYETPEDVIKGLWNALVSGSKEDALNCMVPEILKDRLEGDGLSGINVEDLSKFDFYVDDATIYEDDYDFDDIDLGELSNYSINLSCYRCEMPMSQEIAGRNMYIMDVYLCLVYKFDGGWYIFNMKEIDAYVVDENLNRIEVIEEEGDYPEKDVNDYLISSHISNDIAERLEALHTDYGKVKWLVQYCPFETNPEIVFSVTPCTTSYGYKLIVGITNLGKSDVSIAGQGYASGNSNENVGSTVLYAPNIAPDETYIETIYCSDKPTCEIRWNDLEIKKNMYTSMSWNADWSAFPEDNGGVKIDYTIHSDGQFDTANIQVLYLNGEGYVIGVDKDMFYDTELTDNSNTFRPYDDLGGLRQVAFFAEVYKALP